MSIKSVFGKLVSGMFSKKFLNNCKRTIFMTTLYLKIKKVEDVKASDLEEINSKLSLVQNPSALRFPATLGESLWKDGDFSAVQKEIASDNIGRVCERVMSITPRWMCYGVDPRQMERDIASVARSANHSSRALV